MIRIDDLFNYRLPNERIAQRPVHPYHNAKLLLINRSSSTISESIFYELPLQLTSKDLLIFNNTRVIPARFIGKHSNNKKEIELLLIEEIDMGRWRCMGKPLRKLNKGDIILFEKGLFAEIGLRISENEIEVRFYLESPDLDLKSIMFEVGLMPIPPYIRNGRSDAADKNDYQTFFAKNDGSIAAPTASLHFTNGLFDKIKKKGCKIEYLTLHVGSASFLQLWKEGESSREVRMPGIERYQYDSELLNRIKLHKQEGGRCIAVGTTVVRALESMANNVIDGGPKGIISKDTNAYSETSLFISPGYKFKIVDALITNFHQPRSTHLALVEAFIGRDLLSEGYNYALNNDFRFLSYGDAMYIY